MVNDQDGFVAGGGDFPGSSKKFQGVGRTNAARNVQGEVEVEQFFIRNRLQFGASFGHGVLPGLVGSESSGGVAMMLVVIFDFFLKQVIGVLVVAYFFISEERDQALLQCAEESLDFTFGLGRRGDAMIDAQCAQGSLELAGGVQAVGG